MGAAPVRIGLVGKTGRMGREIATLAANDPAVEVVGGLGSADSATLPGLAAACDVLVDFSTPAGTMAALAAAIEAGTPLVTGTTGLGAEQVDRLREASATIPIWYARTMSTGVSLLQRILPEVARALAGYDVEVIEMHHRHKVDAPSGTALMLVEALEAGLAGGERGGPTHDRRQDAGQDLPAPPIEVAPYGTDEKPWRIFGREGHAPRQPGEIGVHAIRGGGNVGEHTVIFASDEEEVRISHRALSRSAFAAGAIRAAKAIHGQPPGWYGPE